MRSSLVAVENKIVVASYELCGAVLTDCPDWLLIKKPFWSGTACLVLASRRIRIPSVTVALSDTAIATMNQEFGALVARDFSSNSNCFRLGVRSDCYAGASFGPDGPLAIIWDYMLIRHCFHLLPICKGLGTCSGSVFGL